MAVAFVGLRRGPAVERPAAALLLPVPLPPGGDRRRGGRAHHRHARRARPRPPERGRPAVAAGVGGAGRASCSSRCRCARCPAATQRADGSYSWLLLDNGVDEQSFVRSWARWNYTGYEGKAAYAEYRDLVDTMREVGEEHGCGRAFWEYEKEINRYGTPMALMLLPHWTDGCIGSMEGLFFEASATTPFHFLTQVELSAAPSAAQRDLPYGTFDLDAGVQHLQLMGVRYYLATSAQATTAARAAPRPHRAGHVGAVGHLRGGRQRAGRAAGERAGRARRAEQDPARVDLLGARRQRQVRRTRGHLVPRPGHRGRVPRRRRVPTSGSGSTPTDPDPEVAPGAERRGVRASRSAPTAIAFDVDRVGHAGARQGVVLPELGGAGADGPYRVTPNLMVVVPTDEHVELRYGRQPVEWIAYAAHAARHRPGDLPRHAGRRCARLRRESRRRRAGRRRDGPAPTLDPTAPPGRRSDRSALARAVTAPPPVRARGAGADRGRRRPARRPAPGRRLDPRARRPHGRSRWRRSSRTSSTAPSRSAATPSSAGCGCRARSSRSRRSPRLVDVAVLRGGVRGPGLRHDARR